MNEEPEEKPDRSGTIVWALILAPILYVLSIGPWEVWARRQPPGYNFAPAQRFYAPVSWLYEHTLLKKPLDQYMRLWRR